MCGLIGAAGEIDRKLQTAIAYLGTLSSLRGDNSTGYMDFIPNKGTEWFKTLDSPEEVFAPGGRYYNQMYGKRYMKQDPVAIAVHTRMATVGKVVKNNAHPFHHGNIIGMHNGTVKDKFDFDKDFETDSEALIYNLSQKGDEFLLELQGMYNCAYALVWINTKERSLNFYRNSDRPLYFFTTYDQSTTVWASDEYWLKGVLPYFGLKGNTLQLPVDTKFSIPLKDKFPVKNHTKTEIKKAFNFGIVKPEDKYNENFGLGTDHWRKDATWVKTAGKYLTREEEVEFWEKRSNRIRDRQNARHTHSNTFTDNAANKIVPLLPKKEEVIPLASDRFFNDGKDWYFETTDGSYANEKFYRRILDCGCRGCDRKIGTYDDLLFLSPRDFLCEDCRGDVLIKGMVEAEVIDENRARMNKEREPFFSTNVTEGEEEWSAEDITAIVIEKTGVATH